MARDKGGVTTDVCFLDLGNSFDSFLKRWEGKTLIPEYCQVPLKTGDAGKVYPHFIEIQDLFKETKEGTHWAHFIATGDQDLDGFDGDDPDEVRICP